MSESTDKTYAVVLIEIDSSFSGFTMDMFHRWRRFVNRNSNTTEYGAKVVNWRIPSKAGFK